MIYMVHISHAHKKRLILGYFCMAKNASANGHSTVLVRSVDTDVVAIAIALYQKLETLREFWVWFSTGKNQRFVPIHSIAESLGKTKSLSLPMFHSGFANKKAVLSVSFSLACLNKKVLLEKSIFTPWYLFFIDTL